jgi:predicted DCC family thiol-disulfide oxidoreductase YuxK
MQSADAELPPRLVLYDGLCAFCDRTVQRLLDIDRDGRLRFAPLQGPTANAIRQRHPEIPADLDSIVFVERTAAAERVTWHSEAAWRISDALGLRSPWLTAVRWMPRRLADLGYRGFAAARYRLFGKLDQCRIPSPQQQARFLA